MSHLVLVSSTFSLDEVRSRVSKALDAVGMLSYAQTPIQTLSGGQKQRVAIAGPLAEASKVLLLNELTTFLDESDQIGVIKAVRNSVAASSEVAALWMTHRLEESNMQMVLFIWKMAGRSFTVMSLLSLNF